MHCQLCGAYVPIYGNVLWCDNCIDEFLAQNSETMDEFIARKKAEAGNRSGR